MGDRPCIFGQGSKAREFDSRYPNQAVNELSVLGDNVINTCLAIAHDAKKPKWVVVFSLKGLELELIALRTLVKNGDVGRGAPHITVFVLNSVANRYIY